MDDATLAGDLEYIADRTFGIVGDKERAETFRLAAARLRALNLDLADFREDKARLDWLESNKASLLFWLKPDPMGENTIPAWLVESALLNNERPYARDAIDAARGA